MLTVKALEDLKDGDILLIEDPRSAGLIMATAQIIEGCEDCEQCLQEGTVPLKEIGLTYSPDDLTKIVVIGDGNIYPEIYTFNKNT